MQFPVLQALEKELAGKVRVRRECEFAHIKPLEQASSLLNRIFETSTYSRAALVVIQWRPRFSAARAVVPDPAKGSKTILSGRIRKDRKSTRLNSSHSCVPCLYDIALKTNT